MTPTRSYYGGSSTSHGEVRQLRADSFAELVQKYFNVPVAIKVTRKGFHASSEDEQKKLKASPYVTPCSFKETPCHRATENADKVMLACFDLDDAAAARDFHQCPEAVAEALFPLNFILHQTASHKPDSPRLRIIVDVEPCGIQHYRRIIAYIASRLGVAHGWKGSRESQVVTQPMYRPAKFENEEFTAVIASRTDGKALKLEDIPEEEESGESPKAISYGYKGDLGDDLDCLAYLPVAGLKVEDVREALFSIDPDDSYAVWKDIFCSFRSQFREEEEAQEAFDMLVEWSSQGAKYPGEDSCRKKWFSFKPDAMGRAPITIKTLFHYAMTLGGWSNTKIATKLKANFDEWLAATDSKDELMEEGAKRINAMPFKNEIVESAMKIALRDRIKVACKVNIPMAAIDKQVARLRNHKKREERSNASNMPSWMRPFCYISTSDLFYNTITGTELEPVAFNRTFGRELMPKDETDDAAAAGRPAIQPSDFALNLMGMPIVDGKIYMPGPTGEGGEDAFLEWEGKKFVNLYRSSEIPVELPGKADYAYDLIMDHNKLLIAEEAMQRLMIDWMAFVVQNPNRKCRWCIILQSKAHGAGKTMIAHLMEAAIGRANVNIVSPQVFAEPKYNDYLGNYRVVALDEIWIQGMGRGDIANRLKEPIANDSLTIHAKYNPTYRVPNRVCFIAFTNYFNPIPVEPGDRRYSFIESRMQTPAQVIAARRTGHYDRMQELFIKWPGAVRSALLKHKVSPGFNPDGEAPWTPYMRDIIQGSKNRMLVAIEDLIENPLEPRVSSDVIDLSVLEKHDDVMKHAHHNHPHTYYLKELGYVSWDEGRPKPVNSHFTPIWVHRENFDDFCDCPVRLLNERTLEFHEKDL